MTTHQNFSPITQVRSLYHSNTMGSTFKWKFGANLDFWLSTCASKRPKCGVSLKAPLLGPTLCVFLMWYLILKLLIRPFRIRRVSLVIVTTRVIMTDQRHPSLEIPKCPKLGHLGANYHVAMHEPQACDQCKNSGGFLKVFDLKCTSVWQIGDFLQHFVALAVQAVKLVMH